MITSVVLRLPAALPASTAHLSLLLPLLPCDLKPLKLDPRKITQ